LPAGHDEHGVEPVEEYWPAGQSVQTADWAADAVHAAVEQARDPQQAYRPDAQLLQVPLKAAG